MKITSFNPLIVTTKADDAVRLFEELGFEKRHAPTVDTGKSMVTSIRMANADGFHIDIADVKSMPQDMTIIRMNVDNFDEAREMLENHGFKPSPAGIVTDSSSKSIGMYSPSGFSFSLVQHIKD